MSNSTSSWHSNINNAGSSPGPPNGCAMLPDYPVLEHSQQQLPGSVLELLQQFHQTSSVSIADLMAAQQNPADCSSTRYMLVDDMSTIAGLGFSMLNMAAMALQVGPDSFLL